MKDHRKDTMEDITEEIFRESAEDQAGKAAKAAEAADKAETGAKEAAAENTQETGAKEAAAKGNETAEADAGTAAGTEAGNEAGEAAEPDAGTSAGNEAGSDSQADKKKKEKKDKKDEKIDELNDRLVRQMAEFDNFRKRTEKEKAQMFDMGASAMVEKLLPVIDDLERGFAAMTEEEKETSFAKGVEMIYKKLEGILADNGITPIEALGQPFDPNFHNAVMQQPSDEYESGVVMNELQKGYMYKDRVIRHSMVMVAE